MGMSRKRKDAFFASHPACIFCGGLTEATTIEHCPPRAMFQNRDWPEGFEFPSCSECNHGSADHDLIISLLARTDPFSDRGNADGRLPAIIGSVHQKFPKLISKMMPSAVKARDLNRRFGITPAPGQTNQEAGPVHVTDEMHGAVAVFAGKLSKAIYYMHIKQVFPSNGRLAMRWFTNADLFTNNGRYPLFDTLQELQGVAPALSRSKSLLNDQFEYKVSLSDDRELLALQARFGFGFGFVVFGTPSGAILDQYFTALEERTGKQNPFVMLS
ncbi:MAG: hypothetical protein EOO64_01355 [Massilia sp.]|nr:MAG: hypothetical protein EOO64_01355 [Massilia sp.]